MRNKVSIVKKLRLFNQWRKAIFKNKSELNLKFNIRIDEAWRLYTVLNISPEKIGEAYSLRKSDIDQISETFIKEYSQELSRYLDSKGLSELYDFYKMEKVDKNSYLLVFGYSLFKSTKYYNFLYFFLTPFSVILAIILILILV